MPSKVRNLVWHAYRNSLPTKMNLVKRRVIIEDSCDLCQSHKEDVHHALYLCPKLEELWQTIPPWNQNSLKQCTSFIDLLGCILAENRDPTLFSMIIWAVWNRRNNLRLGKPSLPLGKLLQDAKDLVQEFHKGSTATCKAKAPPSGA